MQPFTGTGGQLLLLVLATILITLAGEALQRVCSTSERGPVHIRAAPAGASAATCGLDWAAAGSTGHQVCSELGGARCPGKCSGWSFTCLCTALMATGHNSASACQHARKVLTCVLLLCRHPVHGAGDHRHRVHHLLRAHIHCGGLCQVQTTWPCQGLTSPAAFQDYPASSPVGRALRASPWINATCTCAAPASATWLKLPSCQPAWSNAVCTEAASSPGQLPLYSCERNTSVAVFHTLSALPLLIPPQLLHDTRFACQDLNPEMSRLQRRARPGCPPCCSRTPCSLRSCTLSTDPLTCDTEPACVQRGHVRPQ